MPRPDPVCAACAGPVREGRCPTCRLSRQRLGPDLSPRVIGAAVLGLLALLLGLETASDVLG